MRLLDLLRGMAQHVPDIIQFNDALYIQGRIIKPEARAKIAPLTEAEALAVTHWRLAKNAGEIYVRLAEGQTPDTIFDAMQMAGLEADAEALESLRQVVTPAEVSERFCVKADTVRDACERGQIPARRSGATWLMLYEDAERRWGKRKAQQ